MFIVNLLGVYFAFGFVFALAFVTRGCEAIDPLAKNTGVFVRLMWLPAATFLWPNLLLKWFKASRKEERESI